jgi:uncharacterized protein (TIRG00374 family)
VTEQQVALDCVVEEPAAPARVRRRVDVARTLLAFVGLVVVLLLARFATSTSTGIDSDLSQAAGLLPRLFLPVASLMTTIAAFLLPLVIGIDAVMRRRFVEFFYGLLAFATAALLGALLSAWVLGPAPPELRASLVGTADVAPVPGFLAGGIALFSVLDLRARPRLRLLVWLAVGLGIAANVLSGSTALSMLLTALLGRGVGMAVRVIFGTPSLRPSGEQIAATLQAAGFAPRRLTLTGDDHARTYRALTAGGTAYDVTVFDRDREGAGALPVFWRQLRLREAVQRPLPLTMRQAVERNSLMLLATERAGVTAPRLIAAREVDEDAIAVVMTHPAGQPVASFTSMTDAQLAAIWEEIRHLRDAGLAHGALSGRHVLLDGRHVNLIGWDAGEVAAAELRQGLDVAETLVTCGLVTGPRRAVAAAIAGLGEEAVVAAAGLLQPIVLTAPTRAALKGHPQLLSELRSAILARVPAAEVEPVVLTRLQPRSILTIIAGALGAYVLLSQLGSINLVDVVLDANWVWGGVAILMSLLTYLGATMILQGFVTHRLRPVRTFLAQLAASFAALVTPPAIGGLAVNVRYVTKAGSPPAVTTAQVGLAQVGQFVIHLLLLVIFGVITGTSTGTALIPSQRVLVVVALLLGALALLLLIPAIRNAVVNRVRPLLNRVVPALLEIAQTPRRLTLGLSGNLMLNLGYILALYASLEAFGSQAALPTVAVVYLAGAALGSVAPTPGGLGAVEAALVAGLTAVGIPSAISVPGVLLFRLVTFWLPVLPGYLAFGAMTRRGWL